MTDPIADFLTRIRNAIHAAHETADIPSSRLKREMARILREQGYIESFEIVPPGEGLHDSGLRPGHAVRQQLEDVGRDALDRGVQLGGAGEAEGLGARHEGSVGWPEV